MPSLRSSQPRLLRRVQKTVGSAKVCRSDEPKVRLSMTLDEFVLAHKLSSSAEHALRSKSQDVIQRVLSQGPLEGGNPNLALAGRLWAEQTDYCQQVLSEKQVGSSAEKWDRWLTLNRPSCRVGECDPCKRPVVDPSKIEAVLQDGKNVQGSDASQDAARVGNALSPHHLVSNCDKSTTKDHAQAFELYMEAADQGEADAQFKLGSCYAVGMGVGKDEACAFHWYELAAKQGMVEAQFNLGVCYKHGVGVTQDLKLALAWFTKAGLKSHIQAQFNVALCYQHGEGANVDVSKAARWFKKAASKGHSMSQFQLGLCHIKGLGVPREAFFAFIMFKAAALQGLDVAEYKLAVCYHRGTGVEKDMDSAIAWYTKAADQGHSKAQYNLALCYLTGDGVPLDVQQGWPWLQRAAEQGHPLALAALED